MLGGGGGSVTIGPFICLCLWVMVTRVGRIVVVFPSSEPLCRGVIVRLRLRTLPPVCMPPVHRPMVGR